MENEELIRRQMGQTREALTEKLETLENKVAQSVSAVSETVANVQEKLTEGVESVKEAVDVKVQVDRHPWLMLGGSVLCGFVLGELLTRDREKPAASTFMPTPRREETRWREETRPNGRSSADHQQGSSSQQTSESSGVVASWLHMFEPELQRLKGLALGATLGTVREMLTSEVPPNMAGQLREIIDAVTQKAGGQPIPSSDFAASKSRATDDARFASVE